MGTVKLTVNGQSVQAREGMSVLDAALEAGVYIPHLCSHPDLETQGGCNLCVVEIEGREGVHKSCQIPAEEGMVVNSKTAKANHVRAVALEFMLAGHPHDCTGCKMYLNCELQALLQYTGVVHSRLRDIEKTTTRINTNNPLIVREMERCIQCGRCIRACADMRGVGILQYNKKDAESYVGTQNDMPLADAGCRFCGACVEVCPTGALVDVEGVFRKDLPRDLALVPCKAECPAHIDIPRYVRYVNQGEYSKAVGVIREKVPFPHALGYVCNHRCETGCKREKLNEAVSIRELKRFAVEHDTQQVWKGKGLSKPQTGRKVAIIGAGPTGLTAALYLKKLGHDVTVFERLPIAGGMMTSGMPAYRIPGEDVQKEIDYIAEAGVRIICNKNIESVTALKNEGYDAVLVAIGASRGKKLTYLPGADFNSVFAAVDLLRANRLGLPIELGDTVTIIGGGNVAYDCARTIVRMGRKVNVVCLEEGEAMLADREEIEEGREEGVILYDGYTNIAIEGTKEKVTGLRVQKVECFHFDENRQLVCTVVPDSEMVIPTDSIVFAAGQVTDLTPEFGLELNRFGYPVGDYDKLTTSAEGVFAAGDVITGTRFVIEAIAQGRKAASAIDRYLGGDGEIDEELVPFEKPDPNIGKIEGFAAEKRVNVAVRPAEDRMLDFKPLNGGFTCDEAKCEAGRCLQCDLRKDITKVNVWTEYSK